MKNEKGNKDMSANENPAGSADTTVTSNGTSAAKVVVRGLAIRKFDGEIDKTPEEKDKTKKTIIKFQYDRIVFPWSRTGKDVDGKDVTGSVPSLAETIAYVQSLGFTTEIKLDADNNPTTQSVVGFIVEGLNKYLNSTARVKAENTPDTAKNDSIRLFAKKMGIEFAEAEKMLSSMFK